MKNNLLVKIFVFALCTSAAPADMRHIHKITPTQTLKINLDDSKVNWTGKKSEEEHCGYIKLSAGELLVEDNEIRSGSFSFNMNSITNTDIEDENSKARLIGHLKSADLLNVQKYPTAQFVITKVTRLPVTRTGKEEIKSTHNIEGDLTIKDVTRKVSFDASVNLLNGRLTATTLPIILDTKQLSVNDSSQKTSSDKKDKFVFENISLTIDLVTN